MRKSRRLTAEQSDRWVLSPPNPDSFLNFTTLFGNSNPVEIEIGFGKGAFLVTTAINHPNINFLGLEHERKYAFITASRLARRNIANCKVLPADGAKVLTLNVLPGSLAALHLYFPDPWWKTRHHKRRIMSTSFLNDVAKSLRSGMPFNMATDVEHYFTQTLKILESCPYLSLKHAWRTRKPSSNDSIVTNFERKAYSEGRTVHRLIAISTFPSS